MRMEEVLIRAQHITFGYDPQVPVVRDLDLSIFRGDFVAVLGTNGAGKTTTVKILNGLLKPQSGLIEIKGKNAALMTAKEISQVVGYCYQNPDHQIFCETVREEILFGLKNRDVPESQLEERIDRALQLVGLSDFKEEAPYQLGKGERQKLAVASILALEPEVLIVDEPTTGLDWADSKKIFDLLQQLVDQGMTCLVITHDLYVVEKYIRRTILFHQGRIIADGNTADILAQHEKLAQASVGMLRVTQLARALQEHYDVALPVCTSVEAFVNAIVEERRKRNGPGNQPV